MLSSKGALRSRGRGPREGACTRRAPYSLGAGPPALSRMFLLRFYSRPTCSFQRLSLNQAPQSQSLLTAPISLPVTNFVTTREHTHTHACVNTHTLFSIGVILRSRDGRGRVILWGDPPEHCAVHGSTPGPAYSMPGAPPVVTTTYVPRHGPVSPGQSLSGQELLLQRSHVTHLLHARGGPPAREEQHRRGINRSGKTRPTHQGQGVTDPGAAG